MSNINETWKGRSDGKNETKWYGNMGQKSSVRSKVTMKNLKQFIFCP